MRDGDEDNVLKPGNSKIFGIPRFPYTTQLYILDQGGAWQECFEGMAAARWESAQLHWGAEF